MWQESGGWGGNQSGTGQSCNNIVVFMYPHNIDTNQKIFLMRLWLKNEIE